MNLGLMYSNITPPNPRSPVPVPRTLRCPELTSSQPPTSPARFGVPSSRAHNPQHPPDVSPHASVSTTRRFPHASVSTTRRFPTFPDASRQSYRVVRDHAVRGRSWFRLV